MFNEIIGTHAASCDRVVLVLVWQIFWAEDKKGAGKQTLFRIPWNSFQTPFKHPPDNFNFPHQTLNRYPTHWHLKHVGPAGRPVLGNNNTTMWLHLESWSLTYFQCSWKSKTESSVAKTRQFQSWGTHATCAVPLDTITIFTRNTCQQILTTKEKSRCMQFCRS